MASRAAAVAARELLSSTSVGGYLEERAVARELGGSRLWDGRSGAVACLPPSASVGEALSVLKKEGLTAVPLFEDSAFYGFVDCADILRSLVGAAGGAATRGAAEDTPAETLRVMDTLATDAVPKLLNKALWTVGGSRRDGELVYKGYKDSSLQSLVHGAFLAPALVGAKAVCHRVGVFEADPMYDSGQAVYDLDGLDVISQLDVIAFLYDNVERLGALASLTVEDLGIASFDDLVVSVSEKTSALNAFAEMFDTGVSCVAVVTDDGRVVGNLSASDVKYLDEKTLPLLALPVMVWQAALANGIMPPDVITCDLRTKFSDVVALFVENGIHHIHVTSNEGVQRSVLTPTDVLRLIDDAAGMAE